MKRNELSSRRRSDLGPSHERGDFGVRAERVARDKSGLASITFAALLVLVALTTMVRGGNASAASDLVLAPNLSFDDDSSPNFPIRGQDLSSGSPASGEAMVIFFGTSNCWNTAREAERLVSLYPQFRNRINFVIVDLHRVAPGQEALVSKYYHGYIPTITAIDSSGRVIYDRAGETAATRGDTSNLQKLLESTH